MSRWMGIGRVVTGLMLLVVFVTCKSPERDAGVSHASLVCDLPVIDAPPRAPVDPCRDGELVLQHRFDRAAGAPEEESVPFSIPRAAPVCVTIGPGGDEHHRVTAATVRVDDQVIASPDRFDTQTPVIEELLLVAPGEHVLTVRVASRPGTWLDIAIRIGGDDLRHGLVHGRHLELFNLFAEPSPFSPALGPATLSAQGTVLRLAGAGEYRVRWTLEIRSTETCTVVRALSGEEPAGTLSTFAAFATWDGGDDAGARVADGTYAFRLVVRLVRIDGRERVIEELATAQQRLQVDATPPAVHFIGPDFLAALVSPPSPPSPPPGNVQLPANTQSPFELKGAALDAGGVASVRVVLNGTSLPTTLRVDGAQGIFAADLALATGADDYATQNVLTVVATDTAGNRASFDTVLRLLNPFHPSRMVIRFDG